MAGRIDLNEKYLARELAAGAHGADPIVRILAVVRYPRQHALYWPEVAVEVPPVEKGCVCRMHALRRGDPYACGRQDDRNGGGRGPHPSSLRSATFPAAAGKAQERAAAGTLRRGDSLPCGAQDDRNGGGRGTSSTAVRRSPARGLPARHPLETGPRAGFPGAAGPRAAGRLRNAPRRIPLYEQSLEWARARALERCGTEDEREILERHAEGVYLRLRQAVRFKTWELEKYK